MFRVRSEETRLKDVTKAWQQFESHLATLEVALRGDSETLRLLGEALQKEEINSGKGIGVAGQPIGAGGGVPQHLATSVRDLARLLSEEKHTTTTSGTVGHIQDEQVMEYSV